MLSLLLAIFVLVAAAGSLEIVPNELRESLAVLGNLSGFAFYLISCLALDAIGRERGGGASPNGVLVLLFNVLYLNDWLNSRAREKPG
jgi:hypothetical protein